MENVGEECNQEMSAKYEGKTAITFGVFDLLHFGHFERFQVLGAWCAEHGKTVEVLPRTEGISTTDLKRIIKDL